MKKFVLVVLAVVLVSCGASQKAVNEVKDTMKGEWSITGVDVDSELPLNIKLLNDASAKCFKGSNWKFVANNNSGKYKLSGFDCDDSERYFKYTVEKMNDGISGDILVKPVDADGDSPNGDKGFRMTVNYLDDSTMTWTQYVNFGGKRVRVDMNFKKDQS